MLLQIRHDLGYIVGVQNNIRHTIFGNKFNKSIKDEFKIQSNIHNENFLRIYNQFHNIFRLFDVLPNFPFTTRETMRDYYL